ncbi:hypothetical protein AB0D49_38340 [Streptomyces sp. NPDC048290]|uniref:hypothetical protein n=1 Tax=Streptomyces sp. NPDC048290 TaxID=3155811 RepID=UPI00341B48B0
MVTARAALATGIRAVLVLILALCAVLHTLSGPEEHATAASAAVSVSVSASAPGEAPHAPHPPHTADHCAVDLTLRTTEQSPEDPPPGAQGRGPSDRTATAAVAGPPCAGAPAGPRGPTGLARTSRVRI